MLIGTSLPVISMARMTASESSMSMNPPKGMPRKAKPSRRWISVMAR